MAQSVGEGRVAAVRQVTTFSACVLWVSRWGNRKVETRLRARADDERPGIVVRKRETVVARGK